MRCPSFDASISVSMKSAPSSIALCKKTDIEPQSSENLSFKKSSENLFRFFNKNLQRISRSHIILWDNLKNIAMAY